MVKLFFSVLLLVTSICTQAQNVGIGTTAPHGTAALEISSINKGLLIPRTSAAGRTAIAVPAKGLMVYDTTYAAFFYYDGGTWRPFYEKNYDSATTDHYNIDGTSINLPTSTTNASVSVSGSSGFIYDNGGPAGNYSANNSSYAQINFDDSTIQIKITVEEMNAETFYDSLYILQKTGSNYTDTIARFTGTQTGTVIANNDVRIRFKANNVNQLAGFKIRWGRLRNSGATQTPAPLYGWHFNNTKIAAMGGLQRNNNWHIDSVGFGSLSYGINAKAKGNYSYAMGSSAEASADYSIALGGRAEANNYYSTAIGAFPIATGYYATALGYSAEARGYGSTAVGFTSNANGDYSAAMGIGTTANGEASTAMGFYNLANGNYSTAMGNNTQANREYSTAMGLGTVANLTGSLAIGMYNDSVFSRTAAGPVAPIFMVGNGTSNTSRSNAMVVLQNGRVGIGDFGLGLSPATPLHIVGGTDLDLSSNSGYVTIGESGANRMAFDNNEIQVRNNGVAGNIFIQSLGGDVRLTNNATGSVMVGTGTPDQRLSVNGNASKVGGGSWAGYSDKRLKQNIQPYSEGLASVLKIKPVWYNYNQLSGYDVTKKYVGVLAQELKEVSPYMVEESKANKAPDGSSYLSVDNSAMTYMLINAIKEQQQIIEELRKRIEVLEKK